MKKTLKGKTLFKWFHLFNGISKQLEEKLGAIFDDYQEKKKPLMTVVDLKLFFAVCRQHSCLFLQNPMGTNYVFFSSGTFSSIKKSVSALSHLPFLFPIHLNFYQFNLTPGIYQVSRLGLKLVWVFTVALCH